MPPYKIRSCTVDDGAAIGRNIITAHWPDASFRLRWRHRSLEYVVKQASLRNPKNLITDPSRRRMQVVVDEENGDIIGFARWVLPDVKGVSEFWSEAVVPGVTAGVAETAEQQAAAAEWMFNQDLSSLAKQTAEVRKRLTGGMNYVSVNPDHWRRGIGRSLARNAIREADRLGLDIFVQSSTPGLVFYQALGFEMLEAITHNVDDSEYGGDGDYSAFFLLKKAEQETEAA